MEHVSNKRRNIETCGIMDGALQTPGQRAERPHFKQQGSCFKTVSKQLKQQGATCCWPTGAASSLLATAGVRLARSQRPPADSATPPPAAILWGRVPLSRRGQARRARTRDPGSGVVVRLPAWSGAPSPCTGPARAGGRRAFQAMAMRSPAIPRLGAGP